MNYKIKWIIGICIVLAILSVLCTFLIPDSMQDVKQSEVERYIACYIMLSISFSLFLIIACGLWLFLLKRENRLKREKCIDMACTLGIALLCILFFLWNAFNFYRRFHGVTYQEIIEKYEEEDERRPTTEILPTK